MSLNVNSESVMIDFLKYRLICGIFSILIFVVTIGAYFYRGGFNYSVDFTGGTQILLKFSQNVSSEKVKDVLKNQGYKGVDTREFSPSEVLVRVQDFSSDVTGVAEKIKNSLKEEFREGEITILQTDGVGAGVGASLRLNSLKAILIALLLMLVYITLRFKFSFSVGAIVSLFHDAVVILAFFLVANKEISMDVIAAILAILGYSVNDTIVIYNQIRKNISKMKGHSIEEIVNVSINQTLRRTILTSFATFLVVIALIAVGGEILRNLSLALAVGIVFGTYSSIYIASPVMLMLYKGEK